MKPMSHSAIQTKGGTTSVKLGERKAVLSTLAEKQRRSVHSLVVEAVDIYIEQTQARLEYEEQAIRSYENFQATGLHVTPEELKDWAKSLSTKNPKKAPQCHT
jgi:predicted transcriptional regulator